MKRDYDGTVARIAGNLLSGRGSGRLSETNGVTNVDNNLAMWAVEMAFRIVRLVKDAGDA